MPDYAKTIICLANSRKTSGRCIAGVEIVNGRVGPWIRPVSGRPSAELSEYERQYENGTDPKVLDVIEICFKEPKPHAFQTENHLIDDNVYWELKRKASWQDARAALSDPRLPLWDNSSSSTNGLHDRVSEQAVNPADGSLRLIEVRDLEIWVAVEGAAFGNGKRKVRARFSHRGTTHHIAVTDPVIERAYFAGPDGEFDVGHAILCISLSEPYLGYTYKLVAAVILPPN